MAEKVTPKDDTILGIWGQSGDERKAEDLELNFQLLCADAETTLITCKKTVAEKQKLVRESMADAAKTAKFGPIAQAKLELKAATLELKEAISVYEELFGKTPAIAK